MSGYFFCRYHPYSAIFVSENVLFGDFIVVSGCWLEVHLSIGFFYITHQVDNEFYKKK